MSEKINFTKAGEDEWPICPVCKRDLKEMGYKSCFRVFGKRC